MSNSKKQVMLINMGGRGNIGDRAMALNVIRQIRDGAPDVRILVGPHTLDFMMNEFKLTRYPYLSHCLSRLTNFNLKIPFLSWLQRAMESVFYVLNSLFILSLIILKRYLKIDFGWSFMEAELARSICESDVIFFVGGGYITDVGQFESRTNLVMALFGILARKKVIMSGQGLGPFDSWFSEKLLKIVIPHLDLITFRDTEGSEELLKKLGIVAKNSEAVGDDAMSLPILEVENKEDKWNGVKLGVNFRISPFTHNLDKKVEEFTEFLSIASNELGWQINFFIFETWRPWEEGLIHSIIEKGKLKNVVIHKTEDPREALYLTGKCDIAIGISYHFIVFALKLGVPVIGLYSGQYYKGKMTGLLSWYDKKDWAVPTDEIDSVMLKEACQKLLDEKPSNREQLITKTIELALRTRKTIDLALKQLN